MKNNERSHSNDMKKKPIKKKPDVIDSDTDDDKTVKHVADKIKKPINKNSIKMVKVLKK